MTIIDLQWIDSILNRPQIAQVGTEISAFQKEKTKSLLKAIFCTMPVYLSPNILGFSQLYSMREDIIRATYVN